jgi:hypothetical protein
LTWPKQAVRGGATVKWHPKIMNNRFALINIISIILILVVGVLIRSEETGAIMV